MTIRLVVFDLDGTLLNTIDDLAAATNYALSSLSLPTHSVDTIKSFVGDGVNMLFRRSMPPECVTPYYEQQMLTLFRDYYKKHSADLTAPYPGINQLLSSLVERGIHIGVASNKYHEGTINVISRFFPFVPFSAVFGLRDGYNPKPDPTIVFDVMESCGVTSKSEVLYLGDSDVDILTARNAGVVSAAALWGFRSEAELRALSPDHLLASPLDLLQVI